jgi:hypothetical protein
MRRTARVGFADSSDWPVVRELGVDPRLTPRSVGLHARPLCVRISHSEGHGFQAAQICIPGAKRMKRSILAILAVMTLATSGAFVSAQETDLPLYEGRLRRRREEQVRRETVEQLRFERARERARQRIQQEFANEQMGRSTLRPYTNTAYWSLGLGQR